MNVPESYYQLTSERFIFRKVVNSDVDKWLPFFIDNPSLHFLGIGVDKSSEQLAQEWIDRQLDRYNHEGLGHLAIISKTTNELVGMGGIIKRVLGGKDCLEIAYSVIPKFWGNGYATEMAKALLKFGLTVKLSNQFISMIHPANQASINVAIKNGMRFIKADQFLNIPVNIYGINKVI